MIEVIICMYENSIMKPTKIVKNKKGGEVEKGKRVTEGVNVIKIFVHIWKHHNETPLYK
jgi:predicted DNA-binding antitoxin AbrB/MazE fold protein